MKEREREKEIYRKDKSRRRQERLKKSLKKRKDSKIRLINSKLYRKNYYT